MFEYPAPHGSDDRYRRLLLELPAVAVHAVGPDGLIRFWNRGAELLYGFGSAEALGRPSHGLLADAAQQGAQQRLLHAIFASGQAPAPVPRQLRHKNGSPVTVLTSHVLLEPAAGSAELFCIDIELSNGAAGPVPETAASAASPAPAAEATPARMQDQLHHLAFYDPLTQLPNRRLLLDRLTQALTERGHAAYCGAIMFLDLDNFKTLNDTQGHDVGDRLLLEVAQRLRGVVRQGDMVARLGGDEFVVLLENLDSGGMAAPQTEVVAMKILRALQQPYRLERTTNDGLLDLIEHHCTVSIGVALFGAHTHARVEDLLKQADLAMYQAKDAGRNAIRFFDADMQSAVSARAALEADLRQAIRNGAFALHYQPQVMGNGRLIGLEALLRWKHPARGEVPPAEFIPLAEESGLILPLGEWVLDAACRQLAIWAYRPEFMHVNVSVNISARQFYHPDFVSQVRAALDRSGADPRRLKLELTESVLVRQVEDVISKMKTLKDMGVKFSLDDFGTGYSSLSYLKRLPLEQLKIDKSFIQDVLTDANDAAIARMVIALAQSLGLSVVAEGVENEQQRDLLARLGCHAYQGYLFSRPLAPAECEQYINR